MRANTALMATSMNATSTCPLIVTPWRASDVHEVSPVTASTTMASRSCGSRDPQRPEATPSRNHPMVRTAANATISSPSQASSPRPSATPTAPPPTTAATGLIQS